MIKDMAHFLEQQQFQKHCCKGAHPFLRACQFCAKKIKKCLKKTEKCCPSHCGKHCCNLFFVAACISCSCAARKGYAEDLPISQVAEDKLRLEGSSPSVDNANPETADSSLDADESESYSQDHASPIITISGQTHPQIKDQQHQYRRLSEIGTERLDLQDSGPTVNNSNAATAMQSMASHEIQMPFDNARSSLDSGDILHRDKMLGSVFGLRNFLDHFGVKIGVMDIEEVWGNPTGGTPSQADGSPVWGGRDRGTGQTAEYNGITFLTLQVDLKKTLGPKMGTFNVSGLQIRGRSISQDKLAVFNPISGVSGDRSFRLFELWYEQPFFHNALDVRIGAMDLDTEFIISDYGGLYLNMNFGWPLAPSMNLYSGGPSWPLSTPGVRVRYRPSEKFTFMFAASDDNAPGNQNNSFAIQDGGDSADPSNQDVGAAASGTKFNMGTGALLISEMQYALTLGKHHGGLAGVYKLGGYYDTARFPSYYKNQQGEPLGNPNDLGDPNTPAWLRGNWAVYGIMDQMIWRAKNNPYQSIGIFFQGVGAQGDRNLVNFSADAGINFKAPFHNRPNDTLGLGWGIGCVSSGEKHFDRESGAIAQTTENFMELTYQAMLTPWLNLQPDFQYFFRPGGGVQDYGANTMQRVGDEAILGLHANIKF